MGVQYVKVERNFFNWLCINIHAYLQKHTKTFNTFLVNSKTDRFKQFPFDRAKRRRCRSELSLTNFQHFYAKCWKKITLSKRQRHVCISVYIGVGVDARARHRHKKRALKTHDTYRRRKHRPTKMIFRISSLFSFANPCTTFDKKVYYEYEKLHESIFFKF